MSPTTFLVPKNLAASTLASGITAGSLSLTVATGDGSKFPSTYPFNLTIDSEIVQVTNRVADVMTITRAQEGTSAAVHNANTVIRLNITAKAVSDLNTAVNTLEGYVPSVAVVKADYDINTILKADSDNTPIALIVSEQTLIGRKTSGTISALSGADALLAMGILASVTELNFVDGVTSSIQTQIDAKVAKSLFDAYTILYADSDDTPLALSIAASQVVGRKATGGIAALSNSDLAAILGLGSAAYTASTAYEAAGSIAIHAALTATHGVTGAIVGTTNEQTLTLKTLTTPIIASFYTDAAKLHLISIPDATDTLVTLTASQELTTKTLNASVAKGTWTAFGTWTLPALTLGGIVSGGSQVINSLGHVGIGVSSSAVYGIVSTDTYINPAVFSGGASISINAYQAVSNYGDDIAGLIAVANITSGNTKNWTDALALRGVQAGVSSANGAAGTVSGAAAFLSLIGFYSMTVTKAYSYYAYHVANAGATYGGLYGFYVMDCIGGGTVTNQYGLYIESLTKGSSTNWGIYNLSPSYLAGITLAGAFAASGQDFTSVGNMTFAAGMAIASGAVNGNTLLIKANDTTFITLTTGVTDTCTIASPTITTPIIASLYQAAGGGLLSVPASVGADSFVLLAATQDITGKTYNGLTLVAAAVGFTIAGGTASKTLTISNTITFTATDGSTLAIGTGGTLGSAAYTATTAYEASGSIATHAALTTGIHGLAIAERTTGDMLYFDGTYWKRMLNYQGRRYTLLNPYVSKAHVYKGQLHCHTTNSDGVDTPAAVMNAYKAAGYDFVCITDHNYLTPDPAVGGILFIPGVEETLSYHIGHINADAAIVGSVPQNVVEAIMLESNALAALNHPAWTGLTLNQCQTLEDIQFTEIANANTGASFSGVDEVITWQSMLSSGKPVWGIGVDDCHDVSSATFNKYMVMVFADSLTTADVVDSLRNGNFYVRQPNGPTLSSISLSGNVLTVVWTTNCIMSFYGKGDRLLQTGSGTTFNYTIKGNERFIRARIRDISTNERACLQPIFVSPIEGLYGDKGIPTKDIGVRVYHNANQSIPDSTWTTLAFNSERWDTEAIHDTVTNNSRLTCKTAGKYLLSSIVGFAQNSVGFRQVVINLNGFFPNIIVGRQSLPPHTGAEVTSIQASGIWDMAVDDYVEVYVYQNSGGNLNVDATYNNTEFMMQRIG